MSISTSTSADGWFASVHANANYSSNSSLNSGGISYDLDVNNSITPNVAVGYFIDGNTGTFKAGVELF
ncbi:hypothetical protein [Marinomonas balearica]|uniref:hypothetical protein n=1 Tax=Marinomonas balearica TaxID=491947 RepID=UPI00105EE4F9|nr:hypothetical protein [Marinomonas balearica]